MVEELIQFQLTIFFNPKLPYILFSLALMEVVKEHKLLHNKKCNKLAFFFEAFYVKQQFGYEEEMQKLNV